MKNIWIALICELLLGCADVTKERVPGVYTDFHTLDKDTVWLYEDGTYVQKVYDINSVLVYYSKGKWEYYVTPFDEESIDVDSLYVRYDDIDLTDPEIRNCEGTFDGQKYNLLVGFKNDSLYIAVPLYIDLPSTWHYFYKVGEIK